MILFFLTSGLFLGWSLGANDASNVFGSAVGSRMISFRKAAIISSIAVILGAVIQGSGASQTLGDLGAVNALGGSFTVALAAAVTVLAMTRFSLPVSTTQAIVGAIIGWNFFTGNKTDSATLIKIVSTWVTGPVIGALFAIILFRLISLLKKKSHIHLIRFESRIRTGLLLAGAFGAYSLGANNIANVMGVFVPAFNLQELDLGFFSLSSNQQLFLFGGIAIASGIISYSKRVMQTVGANIMQLSAEAALVVVLAHSLVLFIFSSSTLSEILTKAGLPAIPMVPVSSTQVIMGCIIGIGLYRGVRNINFRLAGEIALGWIITPVISGLISFFSLFFVKNIFSINVGNKVQDHIVSDNIQIIADEDISLIFRNLLSGIIVILIVALILYILLENKKARDIKRSDEKFWHSIK
ncbi:MAG TPA: inorganic phosphate transporter [Bacteroidales bacterium]|nr:inorganic phosphate transporter [Bacteroidales bacterium]HPI68074.1 inorganic phosphate transporter [Bacteroidales bacterium]